MSGSPTPIDSLPEEEACVSWGLGYHGTGNRHDDGLDCHHGNVTTSVTTTTATTTTIATHATAIVDDMMKHYMQQCLEFHHEQQAKRQQQQQGAAVTMMTSTCGAHHHQQPLSYPHFVQGASQQPTNTKGSKDIPTFLHHGNSVESQSSIVAVENTNNDDNTLQESKQSQTREQINAARARAHAVLERFQQQQQEEEKSLSSSSHTTPGCFAQQRQCALQREQARHEQFWQKNCRYALVREQERLAQQAQQLQQTTAWHEQYQAALQQRQAVRYEQQQQQQQQQKLARCSKPTTTTAAAALHSQKEGVGTVARPQLLDRQQQPQPPKCRTVAVYVSGFPTDGSIDENYTSKTLFGSYGTIQKVHFYRNKTSGQLKGDALVIYELKLAHQGGENDNNNNDATVLLETVCQQMNGAELPGGNILSVEPSHSSRERAETATTTTATVTFNESAAENQLRQDTNKPNGSADATSGGGRRQVDDDDLDDFFSSL